MAHQQSKLHPNGFFVTVLLTLFGYRLRLHYWPGPTKDKSPHDHRSWFVSIPLFGELIETKFEETSGQVPIKMCGVEPGNGEPDIEIGTGCGVQKTRTLKHKALRPYLCDSKTIHSVEVPRKTMTIVLFGPNKQRPRAWV